MNYLFIAIIIFCACIGFFSSAYILHKKKAKKKLVCPIRSSCDKVVHSNYSTMFGIPLEVMGVVYYALIIIGYALMFSFQVEYLWLTKILTLASLLSLCVSLYLIYVQVFILKQWCAWCLSSAFVSILIFAFSCLNLFWR